MLGWVEEEEGDLVAAEKLYCYSMQLDPIYPIDFMRLLQVVSDTSAAIKTKLKALEGKGTMSHTKQGNASSGKKRGGGAKKSSKKQGGNKKKGKKGKKTKDPFALISADHYDSEEDEDEDEEEDGEGEEEDEEGVLERDIRGHQGSDDEGDGRGVMVRSKKLSKSSSSRKPKKLTPVQILRQRQLLHDRVDKLATLRTSHLSKSLHGLQAIGKMVYIDPYWLERLLHAFSVCEDWSVLLRTSKGMREGSKE